MDINEQEIIYYHDVTNIPTSKDPYITEGKLSIMMTSNGKIKCWDVPSILMEIPKAYTC